MRALFIGSYPNEIEPYRSVFFKELVHQFADIGVECHVISCVSRTAYKKQIKKIPNKKEEITEGGNKVIVYHPRMISYSAKKIGKWNTMHLTQHSIERATLKAVKKLGLTFDFVYGHFFLGGGITASKVGEKLGIPAYIAYGECSFDTEVKNKFGELKEKHVKAVKGIVAVSSANRDDLKNRPALKNIPSLLSVNSINEKVFNVKDKAKSREKFGFNQKDFIVGFVGYFIERKGPNRVLEACKGLKDVKLAFAGRGGQTPEGDNVIFAGPLLHEEVADFLNAVDVFVLPTLNEGCCNAVVEAMACKKAIVSSDLPFNHDVLNSENSILVDPKDIGQIREAIITLRDDKERREKLEQNSLKSAEQLTINKRANNILDFIKKTSIEEE